MDTIYYGSLCSLIFCATPKYFSRIFDVKNVSDRAIKKLLNEIFCCEHLQLRRYTQQRILFDTLWRR